MSVAVRYYSRSGNTKKVAEYIAEAAGVSAVSVDSKDAAITEKADVLFVGGALYAYGIDDNLKQYLNTVSADKALFIVISDPIPSKQAITSVSTLAAIDLANCLVA